jgi:hypothetical protein
MTQLCALPGCRQRNRHLPGCADDCLGCLPRVAEDGIVCQACADRAERHLAEIERLCPDARLVAAGQVRRGHGGTGGKPGSRSPANDDALDAMDAIQNALTTMAREIADERGLHFVSAGFTGHRVADPVVEASSWLSGQLSWLRHAMLPNGEPYAADAFREIGDCAAWMRSLVDGPRTGRYAGPCSALVDDPKAPCPVNCACHNGPGYVCDEPGGCGSAGCGRRECGQDVVSRGNSNTAECKSCGTKYNVDEQQTWMLGEIESMLARPIEIEGMLAHLGMTVTYRRIMKFVEKGQLIAHGTDERGKDIYRVGDVLEIVARNEAPRSTRRRQDVA